MSRWNSYLNTGKRIMEMYDGRIPLSAWLKDFFGDHKQMGSKDRKIITGLVYSSFRLGQGAAGLSIEDKLLSGLFICNCVENELLANLKPTWNKHIHLTLQEKETFLHDEGLSLNLSGIFPWLPELSEGIDANLFNSSLIQQPDLFLRIRPNCNDQIIHKLTEAGITFRRIGDACLALPNATKLQQVLVIDEEVVIQDYSSQMAGAYFELRHDPSLRVWDCCAGSGGKSIMAFDLNAAIDLWVSDSRASILDNLAQRFFRAGIRMYHSFVADLSLAKGSLPPGEFDIIIADVPCSGSGTWARTPEQLHFFDQRRIKHYSDLQKNIVSRIVPKLSVNGRLIYITCSVFKQENEEVVEFIKSGYGLQFEEMKMLEGYEMKADSMFVASLRKTAL